MLGPKAFIIFLSLYWCARKTERQTKRDTSFSQLSERKPTGRTLSFPTTKHIRKKNDANACTHWIAFCLQRVCVRGG